MDAARLEARGRLTRRAAAASFSAALVLGVVKAYAAMETGSVAMLGSLADTALDLIASIITLIGVRVAAEPADAEHRFGHGKAEPIAALLQTVFITVSAIGIGWRAVQAFSNETPPAEAELGIGVSVFAILVTLALVSYQRFIVSRTGSLAIDADRMHYQSDLLLNLSVIAALVLDAMLGMRGADPLFGVLIALWLAWGAFRTARHALDMLMDKEWPDAQRERLKALVCAVPGVEGIHELKTRHAGHTDFIQFHIWVDPHMSVQAAHDIVDAVEARVLQDFPGSDVLVHVDPSGHFDTRPSTADAEETGHAR
ncbi:cation diffusion facilitator family transporter [Sphingosinicella microcystinivorans]|uniref:cation diffusion facilitator family transporter n=1 Tax=Sphingosinicella microcystinivorans TaxID=335406 RepID=UPI0022F3AEBC|nr:cation diffusion facilitator family transporter [Sphingosinicella microcystinivorans]WBX83723.1 cation diffusion facilitator family transporter [Sphingosinicella microcystinivorans]